MYIADKYLVAIKQHVLNSTIVCDTSNVQIMHILIMQWIKRYVANYTPTQQSETHNHIPMTIAMTEGAKIACSARI